MHYVIIYSRCFRIAFRIGGNLVAYNRVRELQSRIIIGTKQTIKAMKNGDVQEVFIAADADARVTEKVIEVAQQLNIPSAEVDSKKKLGKACGIEVDAATVAIRTE